MPPLVIPSPINVVLVRIPVLAVVSPESVMVIVSVSFPPMRVRAAAILLTVLLSL